MCLVLGRLVSQIFGTLAPAQSLLSGCLATFWLAGVCRVSGPQPVRFQFAHPRKCTPLLSNGPSGYLGNSFCYAIPRAPPLAPSNPSKSLIIFGFLLYNHSGVIYSHAASQTGCVGVVFRSDCPARATGSGAFQPRSTGRSRDATAGQRPDPLALCFRAGQTPRLCHRQWRPS